MQPLICGRYEVLETLGSGGLGEVYRARDLQLDLGGMAAGQVIGYAVQIVDALEAAHAAGIVHRDLKPWNVKVTGRDQVKMVGVEGEALTAEGAGVGPFCYMSPEQAEGRAAEARSDVDSLGAVLERVKRGWRM